MNKSLKIFTTAFILITLSCLICSVILIIGPQLGLHQFIGSNSETAYKIGRSMVEYTLPTGHHEQGGRDIEIIKMVLISPENEQGEFLGENVILISTYPSWFGLSEEKFQQELRLALLRSAENVSTMEFIREETISIQGNNVTLDIYESFGEYDVPTRMMFSSILPGKLDQLVIVFAGPIDAWNQRTVNQFLESIK